MSKANLIAAFLISAFVIDRLVATVFFLLSYRNEAERAENNKKLVRIVVAGVFAAVAVAGFDFLRILKTVWAASPWLDVAVTWLVLVAGAERLSSFIGDRPAESKPPDQQLRVAGTLQLDEKSENVLRLQRS